MKPTIYKEVIDQLVNVCKEGQGQIGARRVREGVWNENANENFIPDQHKINVLLQGMSADQRETLAAMLSQAVVTGVFETLKSLEQFEIEPFKEGYEGSPYNDFIGRLDDWTWPNE